jgi:tetratricopeptide (TPR) repeat protein
MLVPEAPLDAYRSDVARNRTTEDFGGGDTVWLLTAHCLSRLNRASFEDLDLLGTQCASALRDFTDPTSGGATLSEAEIADLCLVVDGFARVRERAGADVLARGIRGMARRMTEAGALSMAYTTVDLARRVADRAPDRERGLLAADQAMVARLLGDLEAADELYRQVEAVGDRSGDFIVLARAYTGRGVIDRVRGNYPRSRIYFERGLELAETAKSPDLIRIANQGLMICHAIGANFDRALQHGWTSYTLSLGDEALEVEALSNLAQLSLDAGYPSAALRGFAAVVGRTDSARVALGSLGGVAMAAAHAGEQSVLDRAAAEIESRVTVSALPYENAQALCQLSSAYAVIGLPERSDAYRSAARKLAKARGFFEILHKTDSEQVAKPVPIPVRASTSLSAPSQDVLASMVDLELGEAADMLCLARSG